MNSPSTAPALIEQSRRTVMITYFTLLAVFTAYSIWQLPGSNLPSVAFLWLLRSVPLLIFLPGLLKRHLRTFAWLSFVVLLYFVQSVQTAFTEEARVYGMVVTGLLCLLFTAVVVYIRAYRGFYKTPL